MSNKNNQEPEQVSIQDYEKIEVDVRLLNQAQGKLIGLATVNYNGFSMDGFKVFNSENGLFLGEPDIRDGKSNKFIKTIYIKDDKLKNTLNRKAFEGYNVAVEKLNARVLEVSKMEIKPSIQKQYKNAEKQAAEHNASLPPKEISGKIKKADR